jgi:hypothetical protein
MPAAALGQAWEVQTAARARLEANDNPNLVAGPTAARTTGWLSASLSGARRTENGESHVDGELSLLRRDGAGGQSADGSLALRQTVAAPRDSGSGSLTLRRDDTQEAPKTAAEVAVGPASRRALEAGLAWTHLMTERLDLRWEGSAQATRYGAGALAGSEFSQWSGSAGLHWRARETRTLSISLSRSRYRQGSGDSRSTTRSAQLAVTETLSEIDSLSVSVGRSLGARDAVLRGQACPLAQAYCEAGLVDYVPVQATRHGTSNDLQYSLAWDHRLGETTGLIAMASRALSPGPFGLAREDHYRLATRLALSERLSGDLAYDESRSRADAAAGGPLVRLRSLSLGCAWQLAEGLSLNGQVLRRRYDAGALLQGAVSNAISVTLQFQGPTVRF